MYLFCFIFFFGSALSVVPDCNRSSCETSNATVNSSVNSTADVTSVNTNAEVTNTNSTDIGKKVNDITDLGQLIQQPKEAPREAAPFWGGWHSIWEKAENAGKDIAHFFKGRKGRNKRQINAEVTNTNSTDIGKNVTEMDLKKLIEFFQKQPKMARREAAPFWASIWDKAENAGKEVADFFKGRNKRQIKWPKKNFMENKIDRDGSKEVQRRGH